MLDYVQSIAPNINREPTDARFQFKDGRAVIFSPAISGRVLDIEASADNIQSALLSGDITASLSITETEPEITLDKVNALGIDTLIGYGESNFSGSSAARIQNIKVSSRRFNGRRVFFQCHTRFS